MKLQVTLLAAAATFALAASANAATLVASYDFNNTLNSTVGGPALTAVDPTNSASFVTDTVNGVTKTVYQTAGIATPATSQGGLTFADASAINNSTGYSVEMTFEFLDPSKDGNWRRIADSLNRTSDDGFYDDTSNNLQAYPGTGSTADFVGNIYRNLVLTVDTVNNHVDAYIDQQPVNLSVDTDVLNFDASVNPNDILGFFLDNTDGGGQGEWSAVRVSTINIFSGVLTSDEARAFAGDAIEPPGVPEPAAWALMLLGFGGLGAALRRRRAAAAFA